jgi:arginase
MQPDIELISAPSILGLKPNGVEHLAGRLLSAGLDTQLNHPRPVLHVPTLNTQYSGLRDPATNCLNPDPMVEFSRRLAETIASTVKQQRFAFVLGGDCSILLGIMPGLKKIGSYGLVFLDAHADFYAPEQSPTGEVADMDLAIVTGRGPDKLTNVNGLKPYVQDAHVIQVGQRDAAEAAQYGSGDISDTTIRVYDFAAIEKNGIETVTSSVISHIREWDTDGFWLHFDTDVLSDDANSAVEYHLPGGLRFDQVEYFIRQLLLTGRMAGISVTIFNPLMDADNNIARNITATLIAAFN